MSCSSTGWTQRIGRRRFSCPAYTSNETREKISSSSAALIVNGIYAPIASHCVHRAMSTMHVLSLALPGWYVQTHGYGPNYEGVRTSLGGCVFNLPALTSLILV